MGVIVHLSRLVERPEAPANSSRICHLSDAVEVPGRGMQEDDQVVSID
jgi:hypothetical protein